MANPLHDLLATLSPGKIAKDDIPKVLTTLIACWSSIQGGEVEKTIDFKIGRAEDLAWNPPVLAFVMERHGGTVNGSSRADLHFWEVDTIKLQARIVRQSYRQLTPRARTMNVAAKAQEVTDLIIHGKEDPRITWLDQGRQVQINIGTVIPETSQQTTQGRRKRFRAALESLLTAEDWKRQETSNNRLVYYRS